MGNWSKDLAHGQAGSIFHDGTGAITPPSGTVFVAIHCMNGVTFDASGGLVAADSAKFINTEAASSGGGGTGGAQIDADNEFSTGTILYGRWTSINLTGGTIIAYVGV